MHSTLREQFGADRIKLIDHLKLLGDSENPPFGKEMMECTFVRDAVAAEEKILVIYDSKNSIKISSATEFHTIIILKCEADIVFESGKCEKLIIQDCNLSSLKISGGEIKTLIVGNNNIDVFDLIGGTLEYGIIFSELSNSKSYYYERFDNEGNLGIRVLEDYYYLDDENKTYGYISTKSRIGKRIGLFHVNHKNVNGGFLRFFWTICPHLALEGVSKSLQISMSHLIVDLIQITGFRADGGKFNFKYLYHHNDPAVSPKIFILASILDKCIIEKCDFSKFTIFSEDSILRNIIVKDVTWPTFDKFVAMRPSDSKSEESRNFKRISDRQDLFMELKMLGRNTGNTEMELIFRRYELKEFSKKKMSFGDKLMLWFSKSNNYGTSWTKPLILMIFITLPIYFFSIFLTDIRWTQKNIFNFVFIFNPAHNLEQLYPNVECYQSLKLFDFILRILVSFFIFQIIFAFRKYSKF